MAILCEYELKEFDEAEFEQDPVHGLVHRVSPPHTTSGYLLTGGGFETDLWEDADSDDGFEEEEE